MRSKSRSRPTEPMFQVRNIIKGKGINQRGCPNFYRNGMEGMFPIYINVQPPHPIPVPVYLFVVPVRLSKSYPNSSIIHLIRNGWSRFQVRKSSCSGGESERIRGREWNPSSSVIVPIQVRNGIPSSPPLSTKTRG